MELGWVAPYSAFDKHVLQATGSNFLHCIFDDKIIMNENNTIDYKLTASVAYSYTVVGLQLFERLNYTACPLTPAVVIREI